MKLLKSLTLLVMCSLCQWVNAQPIRRADAGQNFFSAQKKALSDVQVKEADTEDTWTSLGTGRMRDDFFTTLYLVECLEFDVEVEKNDNKPGVYRVVNPYKNYPYAPVESAEDDRYLVVNASDPDHVYLERCNTGFDFGDGAMEIYSIAGYKFDHEGNLDGAIEDGACGVLRNGHITFPVSSLLIKYDFAPDDQWRFANYNGKFRLKLPDAPDLDVDVRINGLAEGKENKISTYITVGDSCEKVRVAMFHGDASNDSLALMYEGKCNYQDITASGEVDLDYFTDDVYTVIAVPYYKGEPFTPAYVTQELKYYNVGWKSLGLGTYTEAFLADCEMNIAGLESCTFSVAVEESTDRPGYFRLVAPYGDYYPYSNSLSYDYTRHYYMEIDATDHNRVYIKQMENGCGYDMGYGRIVLWSRADRELNNGKTMEEVEKLGYFGKLEGNVITFPKSMLLVRFIDVPNTPWYWANLTNKFKLVLPEGDYTAIAPTLAAEAEGEAAFYDLHGRRVNPEAMGQGVYVKRQGQQAQKIIVK